MKLVFMGAPGAGKGTQAQALSKHYNVPYISTGDIMREHIKNDTEIGRLMKDKLGMGQFVSDELAINIVKDRLKEDDCKNGYILDGFPRNLAQAKCLDEFDAPDKVISVEVADELIIERMSGRRICLNCKAIYHEHNHPPKQPNICDVCGASLVQRDDDKEETVIKRLNVYHEQTEPIMDYYRHKNLLLEINGVGEIKKVAESIVKVLGEKTLWQ